jgi:hypothetical protein
MRQIFASSALVAAVVIASIAALSPSAAMARESQVQKSGGIKCVTIGVANPDGTFSYELFCYKGV